LSTGVALTPRASATGRDGDGDRRELKVVREKERMLLRYAIDIMHAAEGIVPTGAAGREATT